MVKVGDTIAVWFSCGAASAVAALRTLQKYGDVATVRVLNNPIAEEHPDNMRFLRDVEEWLQIEIEFVRHPKYPRQSCKEVWSDRNFMSGPQGAPCTMILKKQARSEWEVLNRPDWHVLGFTADEKSRSDNFIKAERENTLPVLIDMGITKSECFEIIQGAGIALPAMYELGYPNANCIGCVKATSPTYWNHVRKVHPEVFEDRAAQSRDLGAKLVRVKGKRVFLDELDPSAKGKPMKGLDFECGIFCEEKPPQK